MLQRFADPAAIAAEIERVRSLSGDTLRRCWRVVFGRSPPQHFTHGESVSLRIRHDINLGAVDGT